MSKKSIKIVLVGQTGSGKTTFMSLLVNLFKGNGPTELEDVKDHTKESGLDKTHSQTTDATIYTVHFGDTTIEILDTPGLADTRGMDQDKIHREKINKAIEGMKMIDAIILLANGTTERLESTTEYTLATIGTMFPSSIIGNIGIIFTRVPRLALFSFSKKTLGAELRDARDWKIENPLGLHLGYKLRENEMSEAEKEEEEEAIALAYNKTFTTIKTWLEWLDTRPPMPTKEINELYQMSVSIEELIDQALLEVKETSEESQRWERIKEQLKTATSNKKGLEAIHQEKRFWSRVSTGRHNTYCDVEGCNFNCHEPCNLPELKDRAELGRYCQVFDFGKSTTCSVCTHALANHRHYKMRKFEVVIPVDEAYKQQIAEAGSEEERLKIAQEQAQTKIEQTRAKTAKARENIRTLIDKFNGASLSKSFAGHIHAAIKLLESQRESLKGKADNDALKEVEVGIAKFQAKLKEIDAAVETSTSNALDNMKGLSN
ncbi:hypothetical protein CTheo_6248 [Ceratobasidium theobromae]|uniref:AIG1-type G domain-containing protein n=1 Tax=Ceratobasidium theobromae TaxID=1582974 RepID=A0A5N5QEY0_9AGAM|nr:hypothetical protein CTheo_6248 [Ceratobasidium theobromae]